LFPKKSGLCINARKLIDKANENSGPDNITAITLILSHQMKKSETFRPKVDANPDNMLFRFSLGQALYEEGERRASIEHLQKCAESRADWMLPRILLGKALMETGEREAAEPVLRQALELAVSQRHEAPEAELRDLLSDF
jgi:predicted Zn-dependent protease